MRTLVSSPKQEATITGQICGVETKNILLLVRQILKGGQSQHDMINESKKTKIRLPRSKSSDNNKQ